jgi:hypothetical protein
MDVVRNGEPFAFSRGCATLGNIGLEPVLRVLDLIRSILVVVVSVHIKVNYMVAKVSQGLFAARLLRAAGIGGTHVGREITENVAQSHFILDHLGFSVISRDGAQVQMGPGVTGNLMTFGGHALDGRLEFWGSVNLTLVDVVTGDEECGFGVIRFENVKNMVGVVREWTVIVGDCYGTGCSALVNSSTAVFYRSDLVTGNVRSVVSSRSDVFGASRSIFILAAR